MKHWRWRGANPYCLECKEWGHIGCTPMWWNYWSPQIPINKPIHKKKRIRKKLHQGEFQELGFNFEIKLKEGFNYPEHWQAADVVFDHFMDFLHDYGLCLTGFTNGLISACSPFSLKNKLHQGHINLVEDYFKNKIEITSYKLGPFVDMWYLTDDDFDEIKNVEWNHK